MCHQSHCVASGSGSHARGDVMIDDQSGCGLNAPPYGVDDCDDDHGRSSDSMSGHDSHDTGNYDDEDVDHSHSHDIDDDNHNAHQDSAVSEC